MNLLGEYLETSLILTVSDLEIWNGNFFSGLLKVELMYLLLSIKVYISALYLPKYIEGHYILFKKGKWDNTV